MLAPAATAFILGLISLIFLASPWPYVAPFITVGAFAGIILYRYPEWGILGLIALVPFEGLFKDSLFSGAKLVGGGLIGILFIKLVIRQISQTRVQSNLWLPLTLLLLCLVISLLYSPYRLLSIGNLRELMVGIILFATTIIVGRKINLIQLNRILAIAVTITCLIALFSTAHQVQGRAIGLLQDANYFALLIGMALPASTLLLLHSKRFFPRLFWLTISIILLTGLIKTDSRSGLLVLLFCLLVGVWHHKELLVKIRPRHLGFLMLGVTITIPVIVATVPEEYVERIKTLAMLQGGVSAHEDASFSRRASYLVVGKEMIIDSPLVGQGPGTFPVHYAQSDFAKAYSIGLPIPDLFRRAHNTYLEFFSEMGVPAGLFFVGLILLAIRNFERARLSYLQKNMQKESDIITHLGLSFVCIVIFMLFLSIPNHKYFWIFLALSSAVRINAELGLTSDQEQPA